MLKFSRILDMILQGPVQFGNTRIVIYLKSSNREQLQRDALHLEHNDFPNAMFAILHP